MSLEKMKRVAQLWSWLPTFRAAGETQQLSAAGEDLGVSTSAVSRAVRLLEEDLRHPLFDRVGRNVRLNEAGRELLHAVRNAMRLIDEAMMAIEGSRFRGVVRVACDEPYASLFALPTFPRLSASHPELLPQLCKTKGCDPAALLRKGDIDVAIGSVDLEGHGICSANLGTIELSEYVGSGHPLFGRTHFTEDELCSQPRAQLIDPAMPRAHHIGSSGPRPALLVEDMGVLLSAVMAGAYVAALPDAFVRIHAPSLFRVAKGRIARLPVFVAHREPLDLPTRADTVLDAIVDYARGCAHCQR